MEMEMRGSNKIRALAMVGLVANIEYVLILLLLFLSSFVTYASQRPINDDFPLCLVSNSRPSSHINNFIFSPYSSNYPSILRSSVQNLRFINFTTHCRPQYIITPSSKSHVQATIICSKKIGLNVRVRSGGHDYEGLSYTETTNPSFVIVDLVNLRKVNVSLDDNTAWVESGATLGELYYQIANVSSTLGFPAGVAPTVGVGGHFSGGGQGVMSRKFGLAADNVLDAIVVDAKGRVLDRKSMGEDLFWAIRGGGGASFGVILAWKIKLVPVPPTVTICNVFKTLQEEGGANELIHSWQQIAPKFELDLNMRVIVTWGGANDDAKGGKTARAMFNSLYLGAIQHLLPLINVSFPGLGLTVEDCSESSWVETFVSGDEPIEVLMNRSHVTKSYFKGKSDYVTEPISERNLQGLWKVFVEGEGAADGVIILDPYGGRMSEISEDETPFPHRAAVLYNIQYFSHWAEGGVEVERKHLEWTNNVNNYMTPFVSTSPRRAYVNYKDLDLGRTNKTTSFSEASVWGQSYFSNNFKRLAQVKLQVDPDNFFSNEQSIPPYPLM